MDQDQAVSRRLLWLAVVLAAVALLSTVVPYSGRSLEPLSDVPLAFLQFQRLVVGALIPIGLAPAAGVALYRYGLGRRSLLQVALAFFIAGMAVYGRWWFQPIGLLHGLPVPAPLNIVLWAGALGVAYATGALIAAVPKRGRSAARPLLRGATAYVTVVSVGTLVLLAPLVVTEVRSSPRSAVGGYRVAWQALFDSPSYSLSAWILEADPQTTPGHIGGPGRAYLLAGGDAVCLDLTDGSELWRTPFGMAPRSSSDPPLGSNADLQLDGEALFVVFHDHKGVAARLDKHTGELTWSSGFASRPKPYPEQRWVQFLEGFILVLPAMVERSELSYLRVDKETGLITTVDGILPDGYFIGYDHSGLRPEWVAGSDCSLALRTHAYPPGFGHEMVSRPDWDETDLSWLVGIDPQTGLPAWSTQRLWYREWTADHRVFLDGAGLLGAVPGPNDVCQHAYWSLPDLRLRWTLPAGNGNRPSRSWLLDDLILILETGDASMTLRAIDRGTGVEAWRREMPAGYFHIETQPVVVTPELIACNWDNRVVVLSRRDGSLIWELAPPPPAFWADLARIAAVHSDERGVVLVLSISENRTLRIRSSHAVRLADGEAAGWDLTQDGSIFAADGYLLHYAGEETVRSWHPALSGRTRQVKLQGRAWRPLVSYAGIDATLPALWGHETIIFPRHAGIGFGSLGTSPDTGAFELETSGDTMSFGGQVLFLVYPTVGPQCWITALRADAGE